MRGSGIGGSGVFVPAACSAVCLFFVLLHLRLHRALTSSLLFGGGFGVERRMPPLGTADAVGELRVVLQLGIAAYPRGKAAATSGTIVALSWLNKNCLKFCTVEPNLGPEYLFGA